MFVCAQAFSAVAAVSVPRIEGPEPARAGEICAICEARLWPASGRAYLVDGQRVPVCTEESEELLREPQRYLAKLRPEGMLFSGAPREGVSGAALVIGLYVLAGLLCGALCAHMAIRKGLSAPKWFFAGLCLPVGAYLALASKTGGASSVPGGARFGKVPVTRDEVPCPACGGGNHPSAHQCSECGAPLEPTSPSEVHAVKGAGGC